MLIIRRLKLHYTASGIVTPVGGRPVHRLREDSQNCIIQHLVSSHSVGGRPVHRLREDSQNCIIQHLVSSHL